MTLQEYYKLPEGANVNLSYIPNWLEEKIDFPCPPNMSYAFAYWKGSIFPRIDTSNVKDMTFMFYGCENLSDFTKSPKWDVSNVTDMSHMFYNCKKLVDFDGKLDWNSSKVTKMSNMFYGCWGLSDLSQLSGLKTDSVTDMTYMFNSCTNLVDVVISDWNTSKVTSMKDMFAGCSNLVSLDLSQLDTSKVTNFGSLVYNCPKLTTLAALDCSGVNTKDQYPFQLYSNNTTITNVGGFNGMKYSWNGNYGLRYCANLTYDSCINILNGLYDFTGNGETPGTNQGQLKVHANFLTTVGEEISIGVGKGWTITA